MFLRCSGELMNAWTTESHVGPKPTFPARVLQAGGGFDPAPIEGPWTAPVMATIIRVQTVRAYFTAGLHRRSGGLPGSALRYYIGPGRARRIPHMHQIRRVHARRKAGGAESAVGSLQPRGCFPPGTSDLLLCSTRRRPRPPVPP